MPFLRDHLILEETVSDRPFVHAFTAPNPGPKTLTGTRTYIVGRRGGYVVDPGPDTPSYQRIVAERLTELGVTAQAILLTHGHPDHAPGAALLARLLSVPVHASLTLDATGARVHPAHRFEASESYPVEDDIFRVVPAPGHSHDHVAFWLEQARILFAGDAILGKGSSLVAPPEGDMTLYMQTLEAFRRLNPVLIAPGHGSLVRDPMARIDEYIEHRRAREHNLLVALDSGPASVDDLVSQLYADLDSRLYELAKGSTLAQLEKLEREGRVLREGDLYLLSGA
jgi:glyoxylase-like metal-dependent hydrolase (beta-lactamase superfamily II)